MNERRPIARAIFLATLLSPSLAAADAVWTEPCPFGSREVTSHSGPRCQPQPCTTAAECTGASECRPWRVCTQMHRVHAGGLGAFRNPPPPPGMEEQVVGSCAPDASCDGTERPRPPTAGEPVGPIRCAVASYCTRPGLPAIPSSPRPPDPSPPDPARTTSPPAPPATPTSPLSPRPPTDRGSACACRAGGRASPTPIAIALVVPLAVIRRRR